MIGLDAAPNEDGFKIDPPTGGSTDLQIRHGRIYVDGILCELEATTGYTTQPDFPSPPPIADLAEGVLIVAYLDVWHRHIGTIEDPSIREVALGGPAPPPAPRPSGRSSCSRPARRATSITRRHPNGRRWSNSSTGKLNARAQEPESRGHALRRAAGGGVSAVGESALPSGDPHRRLESDRARRGTRPPSSGAGTTARSWRAGWS